MTPELYKHKSIYDPGYDACLTPFAVECVHSFCVKSYTASVENNVLSEQVVSEFRNVLHLLSRETPTPMF